MNVARLKRQERAFQIMLLLTSCQLKSTTQQNVGVFCEFYEEYLFDCWNRPYLKIITTAEEF